MGNDLPVSKSPLERRLLWAAPALLAALTIGVYIQNRTHEFLALDDDRHVLAHPQIQQGLSWDNFLWAWGNRHDATWCPLTTLTLMLDAELYGVDPRRAGGFLMTNLAVHVGTVCLLFWALAALTGQVAPSLVAAAIFAVHPLNSEAVCWVSERKGLLAVFWGAAALLVYGRGMRRGGRWTLPWTAFLLLCSLLSKQMLVTFPFVLLLLDYWPLRRLTGWRSFLPAVREKWLLFVLIAIFCVIAYKTQAAAGAIAPPEAWPWNVRLQNVFASYPKYLWRVVWPTHIGVQYPYPYVTAELFATAVFSAICLLGTTLMLFLARRRAPHLLVGWLWFLGSMVPVTGVVQLGSAGMALRYLYFPAIGLFIALVWEARAWLPARAFWRPAAAGLSGVCVVCLALTTWVQASHWETSVRRFTHTVLVTEANAQVHAILGNLAFRAGDRQLARRHYVQALLYNQHTDAAHNGLGVIAHYDGRPLDAIWHYQKAFQANPRDVEPLNNLGIEYGRIGRLEEALRAFDAALRIQPDHAGARANRENTLRLLRERQQREP